MGNQATRNGHHPAGSHLDLFHTPPTTPLVPDQPGMSLSPTSATRQQDASVAQPNCDRIAPTENLTPSPDGTADDDSDKCSPSPGSNRLPHFASCPALPPSGCFSEHECGLRSLMGETCRVWLEQVLSPSGMTLLEYYRTSLGLSVGWDEKITAADLLKWLLQERDDLMEELQMLKKTFEVERGDWLQFQSDLQVAVTVADRLRLEAEEELGKLRAAHQDKEQQLTATLCAQQNLAQELEVLKSVHSETCQKLQDLTASYLQLKAELESLGKASGEKPSAQSTCQGEEGNSTCEGPAPENGHPRPWPEGKELEEEGPPSSSKREESYSRRDRCRIIMMSERSRSLSRLPLPNDPPSAQNTSAQSVSPAAGLNGKGQDSPRGRRTDRCLKRQDSWSSFYTSKQEEDASLSVSSYSGRPQDSFSMLLRRHGGSRRNSLLRWSQSRTQGYNNIDITNFSSSWVDGLAFCAVYHTYLPTHISFTSLDPENKQENLSLAFTTGESVGITATLTVEEMLRSSGPDWQRVLGYVESIYRHFEM